MRDPSMLSIIPCYQWVLFGFIFSSVPAGLGGLAAGWTFHLLLQHPSPLQCRRSNGEAEKQLMLHLH